MTAEFINLSDNMAEKLTDSVDGKLHQAIRTRLSNAVEKTTTNEDWRGIYFGE